LAILALELVRLKRDVIVTTGTPGTLAAKSATSNIPLVIASVPNLSRLVLIRNPANPAVVEWYEQT